jgi:hypothetical protein
VSGQPKIFAVREKELQHLQEGMKKTACVLGDPPSPKMSTFSLIVEVAAGSGKQVTR